MVLAAAVAADPHAMHMGQWHLELMVISSGPMVVLVGLAWLLSTTPLNLLSFQYQPHSRLPAWRMETHI
jgi:hypothetical protein